MSDCVYHYCSLDSFLKIISNATLRLTDCSKLNDYEEINWISRKMYDIIMSAIDDNKKLNEKLLKFDRDNRTKLEKGLQDNIKGLFTLNSGEFTTFISCFSEEKDLLSQWCRYADDGRGVAIGINTSLLNRINNAGSNYKFEKIIYDAFSQESFIKNTILEFMDELEGTGAHHFEETLLGKLTQAFQKACITIRISAPQYKNPAFLEEKEWRVYINARYCNLRTDMAQRFQCEDFTVSRGLDNGFVRMPISHIQRGDIIIPCLDMDFKDIKNELVNEIVIGPKCKNSTYDLDILLSSLGYDVSKIKISVSKASYR